MTNRGDGRALSIKCALFLRLRSEEKAHTYLKRCYRSSFLSLLSSGLARLASCALCLQR